MTNCNNTINNATNNTTNNTNSHNTTNITINLFRREDTSFLTDDVLKRLNTRKDMTASLMELIKLIHFNQEHPENMTSFVPQGSDVAFIQGRNGWQQMPVPDLAEKLTLDAGQVMWGHVEDNDGQYNRQQAKRAEAFYDKLLVPALKEPIVDRAEQVAREHSQVVTDTLKNLGHALPSSADVQAD